MSHSGSAIDEAKDWLKELGGSLEFFQSKYDYIGEACRLNLYKGGFEF